MLFLAITNINENLSKKLIFLIFVFIFAMFFQKNTPIFTYWGVEN